MMSTMYDSVNASAIHGAISSPEIVAGYIDGRYAWAASDWSLFPEAQHVTITVFGQAGANVADCETGDLTPSQAATWAEAEINAGRTPTIYCNASTWPSVTAALTISACPRVQSIFGSRSTTESPRSQRVRWPSGTVHRPVRPQCDERNMAVSGCPGATAPSPELDDLSDARHEVRHHHGAGRWQRQWLVSHP